MHLATLPSGRAARASSWCVRTALLALLAGCAAPQSVTTEGRRITGSCDGVCHRYLACRLAIGAPMARGGEPVTALDLENRCDAECPLVFPDVDLRQIYESLECTDAVEFIDGTRISGH